MCAAQADVIKVGAVLPLSGEYDFAGKATLDGMQMALDECKGKSRHEYKLIVEDCGFMPSKTSLAAQKLINVDKVDIVNSMWGPEASAVGPLCEAKKIPHMANDWDLIWTQKWKYTMSLSAPCDEYAQINLKLAQRWGCKRIALLWQNSADWVYGVPYILSALKGDPSIKLVFNESFNSPVRDFRTTLAKIKETNPDTLIVLSIMPESEIILRQAKEIGINCRITGYYEDMSDKKLAEGITFICFTNNAGEWIERYRAKYKHDPAYGTNFGYDQMTTIIKAYESFDHKPAALELIRAASQLKPWMGACGLIRPRSDRVISAPLKVVRYRNAVMIDDPDFADLNKEMGW
jgi:branched-chain amino acid transport system substrate-binding protein